MRKLNEMRLTFPARSENEAFARAAVAVFAGLYDPTVEELGDLRMVVSEAVTNAVVHAYPEGEGAVTLTAAFYEGNILKLRVRDTGVGIPDVKKAMEPLFTTGGEERSGIGFSVMESFSDGLRVRSSPGRGTTVAITKRLGVRHDG